METYYQIVAIVGWLLVGLLWRANRDNKKKRIKAEIDLVLLVEEVEQMIKAPFTPRRVRPRDIRYVRYDDQKND